MSKYEDEYSITYDGTSFVVGIVDRSTSEWEANTGNDLLDSYINNDTAGFWYYDILVQDAIKKGVRQ